LGASIASWAYIGDIGDKHMLEPFCVLAASLWAMFVPVIVIGMRNAPSQNVS
jgi:hypothetical protein